MRFPGWFLQVHCKREAAEASAFFRDPSCAGAGSGADSVLFLSSGSGFHNPAVSALIFYLVSCLFLG